MAYRRQLLSSKRGKAVAHELSSTIAVSILRIARGLATSDAGMTCTSCALFGGLYQTRLQSPDSSLKFYYWHFVQVNHSPSFTTDTPLDLQIKEALILETLQLVHVDFQKILSFKEGEKEGALSRLYSRRRSSAKENSPAEAGPRTAARRVAREVAVAETVVGDEGLEAGPESVKGANPDAAEPSESGAEAGLKELESLLESRRDHEDKTMVSQLKGPSFSGFFLEWSCVAFTSSLSTRS
jgi:hypothetical protein